MFRSRILAVPHQAPERLVSHGFGRSPLRVPRGQICGFDKTYCSPGTTKPHCSITSTGVKIGISNLLAKAATSEGRAEKSCRIPFKLSLMTPLKVPSFSSEIARSSTVSHLSSIVFMRSWVMGMLGDTFPSASAIALASGVPIQIGRYRSPLASLSKSIGWSGLPSTRSTRTPTILSSTVAKSRR